MDITNSTSVKPRKRTAGAREIVSMVVMGWIIATLVAVFYGETGIQAGSLGAITVIGSLICWACYFALCPRDDAPVIYLLTLLMSLPLPSNGNPRTDGIGRRIGIALCMAVACCVYGAVLRFIQYRKGKSQLSHSPLWDADVDRSASP
jgi:drug/metabolite transporter (DMT)-like permease